jgi:hypothetical protein
MEKAQLEFQPHLKILQSQPSWLSVQSQIYEEVKELQQKFQQRIVEGKSAEQAASEMTLENFSIQARLDLVSEEVTLRAYLAIPTGYAEVLRQRARPTAFKFDKPNGMADDVWQFVASRSPGTLVSSLDFGHCGLI